MSAIKLNADSGGGSVAFKGPASTTGNADFELTLPVNDGNADQVLKTDGSGALDWVAQPSSLFDAYAVVIDRKAGDVDGGTFTQDAWQTRVLNHELIDPSGIVSLSSNQFTLAAGTYLVKWRAPFFRCNNNTTILYNVTDTAETAQGFGANGNTADGDHTYAFGVARFTISGSKAFEIRHKCQSTKTDNGFGLSSYSFTTYSYYTMVEIWREA